MEVPTTWRPHLATELEAPYFQSLETFLAEERRLHQVFPPEDQVFHALEKTPYDAVKVVLLGQDPYHDDGQAHGLCFSVTPGTKKPPSLVNIFKELKADLGIDPPTHGSLESWASQGILLLNTVLTVRAHEAFSHRKKGWEQFTDAILRSLNARSDPLVFLLWGKPAQSKKSLIDASRHVILESTHPSPLSANSGFFGSKPFSKTNEALRTMGKAEIDWRIES